MNVCTATKRCFQLAVAQRQASAGPPSRWRRAWWTGARLPSRRNKTAIAYRRGSAVSLPALLVTLRFVPRIGGPALGQRNATTNRRPCLIVIQRSLFRFRLTHPTIPAVLTRCNSTVRPIALHLMDFRFDVETDPLHGSVAHGQLRAGVNLTGLSQSFTQVVHSILLQEWQNAIAPPSRLTFAEFLIGIANPIQAPTPGRKVAVGTLVQRGREAHRAPAGYSTGSTPQPHSPETTSIATSSAHRSRPPVNATIPGKGQTKG